MSLRNGGPIHRARQHLFLRCDTAYENEGLPGIYRRKREQRAIVAAPDGVKRNSKKISELEKRIMELEKKIK